MKKHLKLVWRNLWEKPFRKVIISATILLVVFFILQVYSPQFGSSNNRMKDTVEKYLDFSQIHNIDYNAVIKKIGEDVFNKIINL